MSWDRTSAAAALADLLISATAAAVTVFTHPPATFNAPAYIVAYPTTVTKHEPAFAIDVAEWILTAAAGADDPDTLDGLLSTAADAIEKDMTLGGAVQICRPTMWRNYRVSVIGGAELLLADLVLETRM
jgi:hypothetical protein